MKVFGLVQEGPGIKFETKSEWINGNEAEITEISCTSGNIEAGPGLKMTTNWANMASTVEIEKISPSKIDSFGGEPGDILTIDHDYEAKWKNPFRDDEKLREEYPGLQQAYENLLVALVEYEAVKKMVEDDQS